MAQQVLDLDGDVVGEAREFAVERLDDGQAWAGPLKKSGSPKVMCSAPAYLAANVLEHHVARHDAKDAVIDRHNRTMAAEMLAAAAGFGVARDARIGRPGSNKCAYSRSGGRPGAVRDHEVEPVERDHRLGPAQTAACDWCGCRPPLRVW